MGSNYLQMKECNWRFDRMRNAVMAAAAAASIHSSALAAELQLTSKTAPAVGEVDQIVWNLPYGEPSTIDPPNAPTTSGAGVVSNLCDALLTIDENYKISPNIADFKVLSPTKIVYTIRADAKFWNGTAVTADDVAYSMNRAKDPSAIVSFLYANVASVDVTGANEVTVTFSKPDEMFNAEMATFSGMVVEKAYAEKAGKSLGSATGGLMCSGPFKLDEWVAGDHIQVSRNDKYWNKLRIPLAKKIKFTFVTDTAAYVQAMKAGEIDGSYEIGPSAIPALAKATSGRLYFGPSMQAVSLSVANIGGVTADLKLRNAFNSLLDRDAIARIVFNGAAEPQYTALSPATWQHEARDVYARAYPLFEKERAYDIEKSKALIAQSSYKGEEMVLAISAGDETIARIAQLIQQQAKISGLKLVIKPMQPLPYSEAQYDVAKRAGIDLFLGSSFNAVQDPLEPTVFDYLPGAFYNTAGFEDKDVTRLIETSRQSFDPVERAKLFVQMQEIYEKQATIIPVVSQRTVTFLNNRLSGAVTSFAYLTMPALVYVGAAK